MSGDDLYIIGVFDILELISSSNIIIAFALYNHKAEQLTDLTNICIDKIFEIVKSIFDLHSYFV